MFYVGQKVVCVDDSFTGVMGNQFYSELKKGAVYTIRWVGNYEVEEAPPHLRAFDGRSGVYLCVKLVEVRRQFPEFGNQDPDMPFYAERFRPLIERKTDISELKKLENPINHKELIDEHA